jgi:hypothetical protein
MNRALQLFLRCCRRGIKQSGHCATICCCGLFVFLAAEGIVEQQRKHEEELKKQYAPA